MNVEELIRKIRIELVNKLIKKCFGENFKGNLEECDVNRFKETDSYSLGYIAGKIPNPTAFHIERWECVGRFEKAKSEGNYLNLIITNPNYIQAGKRFIDLYNQATLNINLKFIISNKF